jgi:hypothetical protein
MKSNLSHLVDALYRLEKRTQKNSMFAFVPTESGVPDHSLFAKNPVAALMAFRDFIAEPGEDKRVSSARAYDILRSGKYILVEFHLFVKYNDEYILAKSESGGVVPMARGLSRGEDAPGALSDDVYRSTSVQYEGLPDDEDL